MIIYIIISYVKTINYNRLYLIFRDRGDPYLMKLVSSDKLKAGMVVARPIISDTGTLLLNSGITLNERLIELIKRRGIPFCT